MGMPNVKDIMEARKWLAKNKTSILEKRPSWDDLKDEIRAAGYDKIGVSSLKDLCADLNIVWTTKKTYTKNEETMAALRILANGLLSLHKGVGAAIPEELQVLCNVLSNGEEK